MNNKGTASLVWITSIDPRDTWVEDTFPETFVIWRSPVNGDKWFVYRSEEKLAPDSYYWLDQGLSGQMVSNDFSDIPVDPDPLAEIPAFPIRSTEMSLIEDEEENCEGGDS